MDPFNETIIEDTDVLKPDNSDFRPESLPERQEEMDEIITIFQPLQTNSTPHNALIYGPTGQGKTVALEIQADKIRRWADEEGKDVTIVNVGCKGCDSSYHVLTRLVKTLREVRTGTSQEKPKGYSQTDLIDMAFEQIEMIGGSVVIVLDEIDGIGEDDYVLYELSRADVDNAKVGVIGITNDATFRQNLDADVQSSLGHREVYFNPYNAGQLQNILARRAADGLCDTDFVDEPTAQNLESDVLEEGVIPKVAALASSETGDARHAIHILQTACELADKDDGVVTEDHVQAAHEKIEQQAVMQLLSGETTQRKLALACVLKEKLVGNDNPETTTLYKVYRTFCENYGHNPLAQQTFRYRLNDLYHSNVLDKQRRGRGQGKGMTNHYSLTIDPDLALDSITEHPSLSEVGSVLMDLK